MPVFEAKVATRYVTARGQQRMADVAILKRTLFVGVATIGDLAILERCIWIAKVLAPCADGAAWVDRQSFRPAWIEEETFGRRRMPAIGREAMQRFADHVTGHLVCDSPAPDEDVLAPLYDVGVRVRVVAGAFETFAGEIESYDPDRALYSVGVNVFGKMNPVDLDEDSLEAA